MNLDKIEQIESELKRFQDTLKEAKDLAKKQKGWQSSYDGKTYGKHDISGTKHSGAVKRGWLELKFRINKIL